MKKATLIPVVAILVSWSNVHAGPVLLATFDNQVFGAGSAPADPRVEFVLELVGEQSFSELGRGVFWEEGDSRAVDLSLETDPGFEAFAALITNGVDDTLKNGVLWPSGGILFVNLESELLGGTPDLVGYELDFVRLIVHSVHFEPFLSDGVTVDYDLTYEFYGNIVPEPQTLFLVGLGLGVFIRRRRASPMDAR